LMELCRALKMTHNLAL